MADITVGKNNFVFWLIVGVVFCLVAGGLAGYFAFWRSSSPAIISPEPSQGGFIPPTPREMLTSTPIETPTSTPPPKIEVKWETGGPSKIVSSIGGFAPISGLAIENDGNIAYARIDPSPGRRIFWKTEDGGKSWQEIKEAEIIDKLRLILEYPQYKGRARTFFWLNRDRSERENEFREKLEEVYNLWKIHVPGDMNVYDVVVDLNDRNVGFATHWSFAGQGGQNYLRFFLSLDGGESWVEVNAPPDEKSGGTSAMAMISFGDQLRIYVGFFNGQIWQTTLSLESLPH